MDIILTHENADFDAVASQLAAHKLMPQAVPVLPTRLNRNVRGFVSLYWDELPFWKVEELPRKPVGHVVLVDTQHVQTVRGMGKKTLVQVIDHHPHDGGDKPNWQVIVDLVGATTTILVERLMTEAAALTPIEATLLALGVYEDTGSLSYGTTTPRDARAAAWLLEQGASLDMVREFLQHSLEDEQRHLYEQLLEKAETHIIGSETVVIACAQADHPVEEIATLAHRLRDALHPSALFVLVDLGSHIQMVARSTSDTIDVGGVAVRLGGGGHARAAAAIIKGKSLTQTHDDLVALLRIIAPSGVTVADLMSNGVQTLTPEAKVRDADARMRRYGYEGFPVVKEGHIVGLVTRRAVDRAMDHGLDGARVEQIMEGGNYTVRPVDSMGALQGVMMASGWGQIPVVEEQGNIIGVVTRTDLIKHLGYRVRPADRQTEVAGKLADALPAALMAVAREAGRMADGMGLRLFVVGGVARDLLLGYPVADVDFVVEGDAIALTRALHDRFGGELRSHERFGTGKWLLDDATWRKIAGELHIALDENGLPQHIDFVTARTEFYNAPTELPQVERSSIKHDLHRRDFTINTVAIRLDPAGFGQLLDFYGGERDLREKRIRVLHSLSFVDDPTRILRAVRLEQRLGFTIDPRTEELIGHALPMLAKVSGDRIRHELNLIFQEQEPEDVLARLDRLNVLRAIHPDLAWDATMRIAFAELREARREPLWPELTGIDLTLPYFAVLTHTLSQEAIHILCQRIKARHRSVVTLERLHAIELEWQRLCQPLRPSLLDTLLAGANDWVLLAAWALGPNQQARQHIMDYARRLRHVKPLIDGHALRSRGLKPGPQFKAILAQLRVAWLDGEVHTEEEESALVKRLLAEVVAANAESV